MQARNMKVEDLICASALERVAVFGFFLLCLQCLSYIFNMSLVITQGHVRVTNKFARIYFLSFHLLCVIVVLK